VTRTRTHTETSTFGVSKRESHNAARYYAKHLEAPEDTDERLSRLPSELVDELVCGTSEHMDGVPDNCVGLMVTSPNYHVGKESDLEMDWVDYLGLLERVFTETHRVLEPGGRAAINVANLGRRPYVHFAAIVTEMCRDIGFLPRGEVIWVKGKGASGSIAVGSYLKPSNPCLRDLHEYILVFSKGRYGRVKSWQDRQAEGLPWRSTITKEDFFSSTLSIWDVRPESARRVGHPAPFPVELPRRLIELYTWADDVVLDPFMGSGSTAVAAVQTGRHYLGYDIDETYISNARSRVADAAAGLEAPVLEPHDNLVDEG